MYFDLYYDVCMQIYINMSMFVGLSHKHRKAVYMKLRFTDFIMQCVDNLFIELQLQHVYSFTVSSKYILSWRGRPMSYAWYYFL